MTSVGLSLRLVISLPHSLVVKFRFSVPLRPLRNLRVPCARAFFFCRYCDAVRGSSVRVTSLIATPGGRLSGEDSSTALRALSARS